MLKLLLSSAVAVGALVAVSASAQAADPYTFALVPKNTNNPFFDQALAGCKKAEAELKGAVKCLYIGPGEHGGGDEQAQMVGDLITKKVDGIAVSAANAPAIANALKDAAGNKIPVLTWDSDLLPADKGLRAAYVGTHNYDIGANIAKLVMQIKPKGGTICIQSGGAAAANHNERMQGIRDTLAGKKSAELPGERLTGQNGWTEVAGCPLYTNDDFPLSVQQMEDILAKYPNLDAFTPTGGFPQFVPDAYEKVASKYKDKIASRRAGAGRRRHAAGPDRPDEEGSVLRAGRPASVRDGIQGDVFPQGHQGRQGAAGRPDLYRARRLHAQDRRHLHRRLTLACIEPTDEGPAATPALFCKGPVARRRPI